jgi:hypothetical protein
MWQLFLGGMLSAVVLGLLIDPTAVPWRLLDVATVVIGSVTIFSAISMFRIEVASRKLGDLRRYAASSRETLASVARNSASIIKARAEGDFAESGQFEEVLPWFEKVLELSSVGFDADPLPVSSVLPTFPSLELDREISLAKGLLDKCLKSYDEKYRDYSQELAKAKPSSLDGDLNFLMPFLVTLISALSLFKAIYQP